MKRGWSKTRTGRLLLAGTIAAGSLMLQAPADAAEAADAVPAGEAAAAASGQAWIPLRAAAEAIGAVVVYDAPSRTAIVRWAGHEVRYAAGLREVLADGQTLALDRALAISADGRIAVPLSTFNATLGLSAEWDAAKGLVPSAGSHAALAARFVHQLQTGEWAEAAAPFTPLLASSLPQPLLQAFWQQLQAMYGGITALTDAVVADNGVHTNAKLVYETAAHVPLVVEVRFDADSRIDDLFVPSTPELPYTRPAYDDPSRYREEPVVIGEGRYALPGTLTVPADGKAAAVAVLVHGSGPNDRDETIGAVKTFRDLAVGLAGSGIATLRYEKRTREHTFQSVTPTFTVNEEVIDDALLAVDKVGADSRFEGVPVILVGHSQGGMLVPRMLNQDTAKRIDGAVIMAGPSIPLEDILLLQYRAAADRAREQKLPAEIIAQLEQQAASWEQTLKLIKDERYTADNYPADLPLPEAAWWLDFRNNYGGETAKHQTVPLFIVQGDNDVQVDKSNLEGWREALAARTDVAYKLYPRLNHVFVPYDQPSTGAEYALPGNVPLEVAADLAAWMKGRSAGPS